MNNWKSIADTLPDDNKRVLVAYVTKKGRMFAGIAYHIGGIWYGIGKKSRVTHWQELPELPEPPEKSELIKGFTETITKAKELLT